MSLSHSSTRAPLQDVQASAGATFDTVAGQRVVTRFENSVSVLESARTGAVLFDRSHWTLLDTSGPERLDYLHNQTTNNIKALSPGQGCDTCIVTPTARTIDLVTAYVTPNSVLLLASPSPEEIAFKWLSRLIAFSNAELTDVSDRYAVFTMVGPRSPAVLSSLSIPLPSAGLHSHQSADIGNGPLRVVTGTGLAMEGYSLMVPIDGAETLWTALLEAGGTPGGTEDWETLRILQGRPALGQELTQDYNPLEAGLWHSTSFTKGCYIGQETIARLETYNGVKQQLWGLDLDRPVEVGSTITIDDQRAGILTSLTEIEGNYRGLGYIRTKLGGEGSKVDINGIEGVVTPIPYSTRAKQE